MIRKCQICKENFNNTGHNKVCKQDFYRCPKCNKAIFITTTRSLNRFVMNYVDELAFINHKLDFSQLPNQLYKSDFYCCDCKKKYKKDIKQANL